MSMDVAGAPAPAAPAAESAFEKYRADRFGIDSGDCAWMLTSCGFVLLSARRRQQGAPITAPAGAAWSRWARRGRKSPDGS